MHGNEVVLGIVSVVGQACAVHDLVLHNDAAEIHGNEVVLGIVSVVGQACAVHDLVLHNDAAEMHGNEACWVLCQWWDRHVLSTTSSCMMLL